MFTYTWRGQSREMHVDIHESSPQILDSDQAIAQVQHGDPEELDGSFQGETPI